LINKTKVISVNKSTAMKTILVFGMGKVGSLVGILLNKRFSVTGFDKQNPPTSPGFNIINGDIKDE
jgi:lactate dehydrogenase-like 2-hydroxyacid dehydrogenase